MRTTGLVSLLMVVGLQLAAADVVRVEGTGDHGHRVPPEFNDRIDFLLVFNTDDVNFRGSVGSGFSTSLGGFADSYFRLTTPRSPHIFETDQFSIWVGDGGHSTQLNIGFGQDAYLGLRGFRGIQETVDMVKTGFPPRSHFNRDSIIWLLDQQISPIFVESGCITDYTVTVTPNRPPGIQPIQSMEMLSEGLRFTIPTAKKAIGLEYSPTLDSDSWIDLGNFFEVDATTSAFVDPHPVRRARRSGFYRAFLRPDP